MESNCTALALKQRARRLTLRCHVPSARVIDMDSKNNSRLSFKLRRLKRRIEALENERVPRREDRQQHAETRPDQGESIDGSERTRR